MLRLPALKVQQLTREFLLLNLAADDVKRFVPFEVLREVAVRGTSASQVRSKKASPMNWVALDRKGQTSGKAYQCPILREKVTELSRYHLQCGDDLALDRKLKRVLSALQENSASEARFYAFVEHAPRFHLSYLKGVPCVQSHLIEQDALDSIYYAASLCQSQVSFRTRAKNHSRSDVTPIRSGPACQMARGT